MLILGKVERVGAIQNFGVLGSTFYFFSSSFESGLELERTVKVNYIDNLPSFPPVSRRKLDNNSDL